jgi:hypothetical protein
MRWLLALVAVVSVGCGDNSPIYGDSSFVVPNQEKAMAIIWDTYGAKIPMPTVMWVTGDALNCGGGTGFESPIGCVSALTDNNLPSFVQLAYVPGLPIGASQQTAPGYDGEDGTGLAHEMCHSAAAQGVTTDGGGHDAHGGECFRLGGLVDQANAKLVAAGM